jgi:aminoglycoside/choline kinase family phosphotransferase
LKNEIRTLLNKLFKEWSGETPADIIPLPRITSGRTYFRLVSGDTTAIGVYNNNNRENKAFIHLSQHLHKHGVNVPDIYMVNTDENTYLIEDLGDTTLKKHLDTIEDGALFERSAGIMYKQVIDEMPRIQVDASKDLDFSVCYPRQEFDYQSIMWDMNYFKYYFLKLAEINFDEQYLEEDFKTLAGHLLKADSNYFLYRDLQSRNIMVNKDKLYFIDYQGGRKGALQYDLASLLFEAKINLPYELREELLDYYITVNSKRKEFNSREFTLYYPAYILIRIMQAMGAYGYRGYYERKVFYLQSIPYAVRNLNWLLTNKKPKLELPVLTDCFKQIKKSELLKEFDTDNKELIISINSFSYKEGIPQDNSENGGGFVFDCRAMPNPGRYSEFSRLTGKDQEVINFLEKEAEVIKFTNDVYSVIETSILNYQQRSFTNLMINFGCTGGRHRSVYFSEKIAERIKSNFKIKINLRHRALEK